MGHGVNGSSLGGPLCWWFRNQNAAVIHIACDRVGFPIEPEKDEGPSTTIPFLGIELDLVALELRLPQDKLQRLKVLLESWRERCS